MTQVVTKRVRLSYAKLDQPETNEQGKQVWQTAIIIPKSDVETINKIKEAIEEAKKAGKSKLEVNGKMPSNLRNPLHDGDEEKPEDQAYANSYYLNAKTFNRPPQMVERKNGAYVEVTDVASKFYSGAYARAVLNFYAYNNNGKGIGVGLGSLCFLSDGEPLSGSYVDAQQAYGDDFEDDFDPMA